MPFIITKTAAAVATAAVTASAPASQQVSFEQQCYYVPVNHVYYNGVYQTTEIECYLVPVVSKLK